MGCRDGLPVAVGNVSSHRSTDNESRCIWYSCVRVSFNGRQQHTEYSGNFSCNIGPCILTISHIRDILAGHLPINFVLAKTCPREHKAADGTLGHTKRPGTTDPEGLPGSGKTKAKVQSPVGITRQQKIQSIRYSNPETTHISANMENSINQATAFVPAEAPSLVPRISPSVNETRKPPATAQPTPRAPS